VYKKSAEMLSPAQVEAFLRRARQAFKSRDFINGSAKNTSSDFWALELISHEDQCAAIGKVLDEIQSSDYRGPHPPNQESKEPKVKGATMLQFVWTSACFKGTEMYFKFCMADRERLAVLRIHEAHNPNEYEG
jgi:hypothetical protein